MKTSRKDIRNPLNLIFSEINELIDLAANDRIIDASEFQNLILTCTNKGIQVDRAEHYIVEYCKKKGLPAPLKSENAEYKKQIQCGVCHRLNDPSANNCGNCASPLKLYAQSAVIWLIRLTMHV